MYLAGSEKILRVLINLQYIDEDSIYARFARQFARLGIIYTGDSNPVAFCPFCVTENPNNLRLYFTNMNSHYGHAKSCPKCQIFQKYIEQLDNDFLNMLTKYCCEKNISMEAICSKSFSELLHKINPFLKSVPRKKLREHIYTLFENLRTDLNKDNCGEFCSLLIDGAQRFNFNFYGFIIHSPKRLFYYQIKHLNKADSERISSETSQIINFINNVLDIEIIAVCTDHAANVKKAFNASDPISSQILTGSYFLWIGCFCHLLNLCISDLFKNTEFQKYFNILNRYLEICKNYQWPNIPSFCKTRWESLDKCFNAIFSFSTQITASLNTKILELEYQIQHSKSPNCDALNSELNQFKDILQNGFLNPKFFETAKIIAYMADLVFQFGADGYLIYNVYSEIINFINFLNTLSTDDFTTIISKRIFESDEIDIARASYFLTPEGYRYFMDLNENEKNSEIYLIKNFLISYFGCRFTNLSEEEDDDEKHINMDLFEQQFELLLNMVEIPLLDDNPIAFWEQMRSDHDLYVIAELAVRLLSMPCSEAAVERLFSNMKYLYGQKNRNLKESLINAEVGIKMQNLYKKKEK